MPRTAAWITAGLVALASAPARAEFDATFAVGPMVTFGNDQGAVLGSAGDFALTLGGHWSSYVLGARVDVDTGMPSLGGTQSPPTMWSLYFRKEIGDRHELHWFCGVGLGVSMVSLKESIGGNSGEFGPMFVVDGGFGIPLGGSFRLLAGIDLTGISFDVSSGVDSLNVGAFVGVAY